MGQAAELGVLLSLAVGLGTFLAPVETFHDQESELETLAQAAEKRSSLIQPAELGPWLSREVVRGTSLPLLLELGTLLAPVAALRPLQVQAVGLQVFQDLLAELVFGLNSAGKVLLCQGLVVLSFLLAGTMLTSEGYLVGSLPSLVLAV